MTAKNQGIFVTIEGVEGVGKSTAVKFIQEYLSKKQQQFVVTREPGGTPVAEEIRKILLTPNAEETINSDTELLLMFACRAQHIHHVILPALQAGKWVICDRFVDASFAYQGGGRQLNINYLNFLENWIVGSLKPTVTILLDTSPQIGLTRAKHRGAHDRIEQEKIEFFDRVRAGYLQRAELEPDRFRIIDAAQSLDVIQNEIKTILDNLRPV